MNFFPRLQDDVKAFIAEGKGNFKKAGFIIGCIAALLVGASVVLHLLDPIAGWVGVLMLQIIFVIESCFVLLMCLEYEERRGYEAGDMQRLTNGLYGFELWVRVAQAVQLVFLRSYVTGIICALVVAYDLLGGRKVRRADATTLWRDIKLLSFDAKVKVGANGVLFLVIMAAMIIQLVGNPF